MLDPPILPPLQLKVAELVARDYPDQAIADVLRLKRKTVSKLLSEHIFPKLGVRSRVGVARWHILEYSGEPYKYPDTYLVELRRLGLEKTLQETTSLSVPFELSDHMGQWCAWCVRYFSPGDAIGAYRPYHPSGRVSLSDDMLVAELELERVFDWALPVHHGGCPLAKVEPNVGVAAVPLGLFFRCQPPELENFANTAYLRGNLVTSVALRLLLYHQHFIEGNEGGVASALAKATIDNAGAITNAAVGTILRSHMPSNIHTMPYEWIQILLGLGNRVRNNGNPGLAEKRCYGKARWETDKIRAHKNQRVRAVRIADALERREMTVTHPVESKTVVKVIDNARDHNDRRGLLTACQIVGWHYFRDKDYAKAAENFSLIELEGKTSNTTDSWWHKMSVWLGLGATLYASDRSNYAKALGYCLMAEYVSAILGLQVDVTRGISEQLLGSGVLLSPSALVRQIAKESNFAKEKMEEIRHTALIESGLQKELLAELSGASWAFK